MENIEKFRIIHNQFQFSKAFTLEFFKFGDVINSLNNSIERDNKIEELIRFLKTYNFNSEQELILRRKEILLKLCVNNENYNEFISNEIIYDKDFLSTCYSEIKQIEIHKDFLKRRRNHTLKMFFVTFIVMFLIGFFVVKFIKKTKSNQNNIKKEEIIKSPEIKDTLSPKKEGNKMNFCDCYDLMMEINDGRKLDAKKIQIYQDECREMLTHGSSMMELKEFDKKMSDCQ
jgi:hypothetical protein